MGLRKGFFNCGAGDGICCNMGSGECICKNKGLGYTVNVNHYFEPIRRIE